jgi:hypothetical protein
MRQPSLADIRIPQGQRRDSGLRFHLVIFELGLGILEFVNDYIAKIHQVIESLLEDVLRIFFV